MSSTTCASRMPVSATGRFIPITSAATTTDVIMDRPALPALPNHATRRSEAEPRQT